MKNNLRKVKQLGMEIMFTLISLVMLSACGNAQEAKTKQQFEAVCPMNVIETNNELDWTQFRGVLRDGISPDTNLLSSWPAEGPQKIWEETVGSGYSGIVVSKGRLLTAWDVDDSQYLFCLNAANRQELWRFRIDSNFVSGWGDGPMSTPVVDGDLVYITSAKGQLHAVNIINGKSAWSKDMATEFGFLLPVYGYSPSPLVDGDKLFIQAGGKDDWTFIALNKTTGELIWHSQTDKAAYSSPLAITANGIRQIVFMSATRLFSLSPDDGHMYWEFWWEANCATAGPMNLISPFFIAPDKLFISGGSGSVTGGSFVKINEDSGVFTLEELWYNQEINNMFNPSVYVDGYIYGFHEKILRCIDAANGSVKWESEGLNQGSLIAADGNLIALGENGKLVLVKADPEKYTEIASMQVLQGRCWTSPTLANGLLFLRNQKKMVCLDLRAK